MYASNIVNLPNLHFTTHDRKTGLVPLVACFLPSQFLSLVIPIVVIRYHPFYVGGTLAAPT